MLGSAGGVTIVRGNSVTLMEQGSFVTTITIRVRAGLDCLWVTQWKNISTNPKWPHAQVGTPCTPCMNSADGYMYNTMYSVPWRECVRPDREITSPLLDVAKDTYAHEDSR